MVKTPAPASGAGFLSNAGRIGSTVLKLTASLPQWSSNDAKIFSPTRKFG